MNNPEQKVAMAQTPDGWLVENADGSRWTKPLALRLGITEHKADDVELRCRTFPRSGCEKLQGWGLVPQNLWRTDSPNVCASEETGCYRVCGVHFHSPILSALAENSVRERSETSVSEVPHRSQMRKLDSAMSAETCALPLQRPWSKLGRCLSKSCLASRACDRGSESQRLEYLLPRQMHGPRR